MKCKLMYVYYRKLRNSSPKVNIEVRLEVNAGKGHQQYIQKDHL
ncbi:hypothetical protein Aconfl_24520 [Algoriphagus confluentis]|uniref:Arm DNA-binding domain-containing protein n=1 Tax=Algoriphagus confluentis TaxID=1697556 RepID=A0ABQ6PPC8_9BACT|nr:hypothetical protein Aconfl_24520 [Algoriphagus confluentis]